MEEAAVMAIGVAELVVVVVVDREVAGVVVVAVATAVAVVVRQMHRVSLLRRFR